MKMKRIFLTEEQIQYINENVFMSKDKVNLKNKTIGLEYNNDGKNKNAITGSDSLKTDKMHQNNGDTYEVTLKDGTICYNITSIKGTEVMHFFKKVWAEKKKDGAQYDVDMNGEKIKMNLTMEEDKVLKFLQQFCKKIGYVVNYVKNSKFPKDVEFTGISLYPIPSSSKFNDLMCNELIKYNLPINGMQLQKIDSSIIEKDLSNIQRDEDFIEKNKDFFDGKYSSNAEDGTVNSQINGAINKFDTRHIIAPLIEEINQIVKQIDIIYRNTKKLKIGMGKRQLSNLLNHYNNYVDKLNEIKEATKYINSKGEVSKQRFNNILTTYKGTKEPSREEQTEIILAVLKNNFGKNIKKTEYPIQKWDLTKFEIKNLSNSIRMGIKNIYNINNRDIEKVQEELARIKGTIFVMFDDNVSGGATLSDIVRVCKENGIEYVIPITFGEMSEKWTMGRIILNKPKMNNGHTVWNTIS